MKAYLTLIFTITLFANALAQRDSIYKDLKTALKNSDKVYKLDLSNKDLDAIPIDLQKLKNLQELNISNNNINTVKNIKLENLKTIDLSNNNIQTIEKADIYKYAINVNLDNNDIKKVDIDLYKLYNLENVSLTGSSGTTSLANSKVWENIVYLNSIGDTEAAKTYQDLNLKNQDYFKNVSEVKRKLEPWEHSGHSIGYNSGKNNVIIASSDGFVDKTLVGKKVKITLDQLYIYDYPGKGKHYVLFDFKVNNSLADNTTEIVHFNQVRTAQENQPAGLLSIPIFVNLNIPSEGILFNCLTINVKNESDENFLEILDSSELKQGIELTNKINPVVPIITNLAQGIAKKIASRNKNIIVQDFAMGLDFSDNQSKAKLRKGTYIVAQTGMATFPWLEWEFKNGNVVLKNDNAKVLPYNYLVFSID